jgi:hypothetical protein
VDDSKRPIRFALMVLIPLVVGYYAYSQAAARIEAPAELRAIHPAPPASISFKGKTLDIQGLDNPLRKDAANLKKYVAEGAVIYIKNCMYCHGDNLDGAGHFAHAFNPPPANFTDPGTIAMLQEAYLFWRIARAGRSAEESKPNSSCRRGGPARGGHLEGDHVPYDATGYQPRRWESHAAAPSRRGAGPGGGSLSSRFSLLPWPRAFPQRSPAARTWPRVSSSTRKVLLCHGRMATATARSALLTRNPGTSPRESTRSAPAPGQPPRTVTVWHHLDGMPGTSMPAWKALSKRIAGTSWPT